jgi:methylmalonyl-CoA mutase
MVVCVDNAQVRQEQCEALVAMRASRDSVAATAALDALTQSAALETSTGPGDHPQNLLRLAVAAARARCSVGEISDALEAKWGRYAVTSSVVQGAYADTVSDFMFSFVCFISFVLLTILSFTLYLACSNR